MREADLAIIGAGVAGLSAALVAAQHGLHVLVIERIGAGGQVMNVETIHNMPGFPQGVSGFELGPLLQEQAEAAGAEFTLDTVQRIEPGVDRHILHCEGEAVSARALIVAVGSARRKLGVPGEEMEGRGVSHCASCDGPMFRDQPVCVVGGGDSAFGEAAVLAAHASHVTLVFREPAPHAQDYLLDAVKALPNVELVGGAQVTQISGDSGVTGVRLQQGGVPRDLAAQGVFVYAGLQADSGFLADVLKLDDVGRIETDAAFRTSVPGIFAAGDVRSGAAYLLASVAEEGAAAAKAACRHLQDKA